MIDPDNQELIESLRLRLLDSTPDLLAIASAEGRFLWLSDAWSTTLGWTREELMAAPFLDFVLDADRVQTLVEFETMMREGRDSVRFQNRYRHKAGGHRWLEWNATVVEHGNTLCVARDVTERKEQEQLENERMRQMQMAEELVGLGHWRVDLKAGTPYWSPKVYEIHGRPPSYRPSLEEAIEAYHADDRDRISGFVAAAVERQQPFEFEARIVRPCGEVRWVHSKGLPEVDGDGEVVSLFGVFRDITDERRIEESMRRSERMASIGTMAAGIAHEINNPLSYVLGNLQLLQEDLDELQHGRSEATMAGMREMLSDSAAGAQRIGKIVDGVRSFTRMGAASASPVDVNEAVRSAVAFAEHETKVRAGLSLELHATRPVSIDETQLVQVLVNLLVNAAQALPEGCASQHRIKVVTHDEDDRLVVRVSDTGPGVPAEVRARIFDPFFTTKDVGSGTGLGLSICHTIVEQAGGSIELESTGVGASFAVRLPVTEAMPDRDVETVESADAEGHMPVVLVVDDEPGVLAMITRALRRSFVVQTARSGREALDRVAAGERFDLVACDLMMPDLGGMDVLRRLCDDHPELLDRFLFMTGGTFSAEERTMLDDLNVSVVRKPIDVAVLREQLQERLVAVGRRT